MEGELVENKNKSIENGLTKITKTTHYWFLKPTVAGGKYFYVRTVVEGLNENKPVWFIGYEGLTGFVSSVGGEIGSAKQRELEEEYQSLIK